MMSVGLSRETVEAAGFGPLWEAIDELRAATPDELARLERAPILVLGALADHARELWAGERVRVLPPEAAVREPAPTVALEPGDTGLAFLRRVALTRLATRPPLRVRVDWASAGMELVQAALHFGADEVVGELATKAGLPLLERASRALRKVDVAGLIKRAGRLPVFVSASGREQEIDAPGVLPAAHRAAEMLALAGDEDQARLPDVRETRVRPPGEVKMP